MTRTCDWMVDSHPLCIGRNSTLGLAVKGYDFLDLGNRRAVDQPLSRLVKEVD